MNSLGSMHVIGTDHTAEWRAALGTSRQHDFHHMPEYHRVAEQRGEGVARLFIYRQDDFTIALPLLLRRIESENEDVWQDATSVYGYGGPVCSHEEMPAEVVGAFQAALTEELAKRRVISVFSRLHPLIAQEHLLSGLGECVVNGETVSIDLTGTEEEQMARYHRSCRKSVRKLQQLGFIGIHDREKRYLSEFVDVYLETMRRAGAQSSYFFDQAYFDLLARELAEVSHLFVALKDGVVAAATLCTLCDGIVQDHLGGTRDAYLKFSPDRLVVDTERRWAREMNARIFHLGGGVGAQQDSVFRYKSAFSDRRHLFRTWRWILRADVYADLTEDMAASLAVRGLRAISASYFPAYRCPAIPAAEEFITEHTAVLAEKEGCLHA